MGKTHQRRSANLRKSRVSEPGRAYLVTTVTYQRRPLFENLYAGRRVIHALRHLHHDHWICSLAFVLMPDHLHWLMQLGEAASLEQVMHTFKSFTAKALNRMLQKTGRVWQTGYHDHALRSEEDIKAIARYIIANPLRAGLVEEIGAYSHWDAIWL